MSESSARQPGGPDSAPEPAVLFLVSRRRWGAFTEVIIIPLDIGIGDHHLSLCWGSLCSLEVPLTVVAPGTLPSPRPSASPSASASGTPVARRTPTEPEPRRDPRPHKQRRLDSDAKAFTKSAPKSSPTPTNQCPTATSPAKLSGPATVNNGTSFTATGTNFTPGKTVTVKYYDPSTSTSPTTWTGTVACNGSFSHQFTTVASLLLSRTDKVTAKAMPARRSGRRATHSP